MNKGEHHGGHVVSRQSADDPQSSDDPQVLDLGHGARGHAAGCPVGWGSGGRDTLPGRGQSAGRGRFRGTRRVIGHGARRRDHERENPRRGRERRPDLSRRPVRPADRRFESIHAAAESRALDRRARRLPERPLVAAGRALTERHRMGSSRERGAGRGLSRPEYLLDRRERRPQAAGHGVDPRGRLHVRFRLVARVRRRKPCANRRRRRHLHQPPPQRRRPPLSRRRGRRIGRLGERRHARHRRGVAMGAGQCRAVRRRPGQRHDLRAVGRRRQSQHARGDACGKGPVPQGHRRKRVDTEADDAR